MPDDKILKAALWYSKQGFSVIPVPPPKADEKGKDIKVPLIKWTPYQKEKASGTQIQQWYSDHPDSRVGIVTGKTSNLLVVDCDTEEAKKQVDELLPDSAMIPIVASPHGFHFYFLHEEGFSNRAKYAPGIDVRTEGGYVIAPPSTGLNGKGYAWLDGLSPYNVPISNIPLSLKQYLISSIKGGVVGGYVNINNLTTKATSATFDNKVLVEGRRDDDIFHLANTLLKGGMPSEEALLYLRVIARACEPPYPDKELEIKIQSAFKRAENREYSISEDVRQWVLTTPGTFLTTECYNGLHLTTRHHKKSATVALLRMEKDGLIEKYGTRRGSYRRVDNKTEEIKWYEADCNELQVKLPLGLEQYVKVMPKTLTIIAGTQDAGKTALLLNFAYQNIRKHEIYYFSSEMDANELAMRLKCLEPYEEEVLKKIHFKDRTGLFADVIEPNALNIIDYFEITDNFFRIADEFTQIRNKLEKGIAIIALQKDPKKELGRGASFSMEKPRIYLTLDREIGKGNILRVQKAKNWRNPEINPNGLSRQFWIFQGINLKPKGSWEME